MRLQKSPIFVCAHVTTLLVEVVDLDGPVPPAGHDPPILFLTVLPDPSWSWCDGYNDRLGILRHVEQMRHVVLFSFRTHKISKLTGTRFLETGHIPNLLFRVYLTAHSGRKNILYRHAC